MENILLTFFTLLVFPGLLFIISLSFFTQYLVRKITARFQSRMGPSYVGPAGILQPFMDFSKLLRVKEVVKNPYSMIMVAEISLLLGIAFIISAVLLLPLGFIRLSGSFDILVFFYMTSVMPLFMLIIASLSMPNPYTNIGVSRLLSLSTIVEPTYFASILIPIYMATRGKEPFLSITSAYGMIPSLWLNTSGVVLALCLIAFIVSVQAKAMYPPFNIPEAEQEIIAGFETEFSGPVLALARLLHDLDVTIAILLGVYVLLGGPAPFRHLSIWGAITLVAKYIVLLFLVILIKNIMGRYRIEQALVQIFKYGFIPALLATLIAIVI